MDGIRVDTQRETLGLVIVLKAKLYDSHCENEELRKQLEQTERELKEARALLRGVVASATVDQRTEPSRTDSVCIANQGPPVSESLHSSSSRVPVKRPRSPSLEYVDLPLCNTSPSKGKLHESVVPAFNLQALPSQAVQPQVEIIDLTEWCEIGEEDFKPDNSQERKPVQQLAESCCVTESQGGMSMKHEETTKRRKVENPCLEAGEESPPQASCSTREVNTVDIAASSKENQNLRQLRSTTRRLNVAIHGVGERLSDTNHLIEAEACAQNSELRHSERGTLPQVSAVATHNSNLVDSEAGPSQQLVQVASPRTFPNSDPKAFNLPAEDVQQYLSDVAPFAIQPEPILVYVPRAFLRISYGGSDQSFLQNIAAERNPSGALGRRLVFPTLDLNPAMPSVPGAPGLVFASRHEILQDAPWTVFCKKSNKSPVVWLYVGEYENTLKGKMTKEQFSAQSLIVQREWARSLLKCKRFDVYVAMRARVALRLAGMLPLLDDPAQMDDEEEARRKEEQERLVQEEVRAIKMDKGRPVSVEDLRAAFINGEEGIDIIQMKCVGYDHVFAADMRERLTSYSRPKRRTW